MDQFFCCSSAHVSVHRWKLPKTLPLPSAADAITEHTTRERHLRESQFRSTQRWRMLHEIYDKSVLLTPHEKLDEEDREDFRAYQNYMERDIHLLRAAEELAKHLRGRLKNLHRVLHEQCREKNISLTLRDCPYCLETESFIGLGLELTFTGGGVAR